MIGEPVTPTEGTGGRPRLLDTFCKAGGATKGYQRAGFYVVGVDIEPQPNYCGDEFHQADAIELLRYGGDWLREFDAVHASPPCQDWSSLASVSGGNGTGWMLDATLAELESFPGPWVVENVEGAPLARAANLFGRYGAVLCGTMFGLQVLRHRLFESNVPLDAPEHPAHVGDFYSPAGHGDPNWRHRSSDPRFHGRGYHARCSEAMGIDWMNRDELSQAIPPAYTELVGRALLASLGVSKEESA